MTPKKHKLTPFPRVPIHSHRRANIDETSADPKRCQSQNRRRSSTWKEGHCKITAVRSLAALLPEVTVVQGCPYNCSPEERQGLCTRCETSSDDSEIVVRQIPIVDLPVGATEDRLVGSLDIEEAIKTGNRVFEPGLIAGTHRGSFTSTR
ncbi:MAG: hypothetical protein CM1200mP27_06980 [Chloroflexota bacterium]|nr:MAG: hypothetical protein CM1200mP27_06980 [Chloroflexota bacterium]